MAIGDTVVTAVVAVPGAVDVNASLVVIETVLVEVAGAVVDETVVVSGRIVGSTDKTNLEMDTPAAFEPPSDTNPSLISNPTRITKLKV